MTTARGGRRTRRRGECCGGRRSHGDCVDRSVVSVVRRDGLGKHSSISGPHPAADRRCEMARLGRPAWLLVDLLDRRAALVGLAVLCVVMSDCADSGPRAASVSRPALVPTATVGHFAHFPLPPGVPAPNRLTAGPDGALWFTAFDTAPGGRALFAPTIHDALVRLTTAGSFTAFPLPYAGGWPGGITAGPDGNVWF